MPGRERRRQIRHMIADMIYQKVKEYILQHRMIEQGDFVAAGVSGGADSVCLLYLLRRLQKEIACGSACEPWRP